MRDERNKLKGEITLEVGRCQDLAQELENAKRENGKLRSKNMMLNFKLDGINGQFGLIKEEKQKEIKHLEHQLEQMEVEIYNLKKKKHKDESEGDVFLQDYTAPSGEFELDDNLFDLTLLDANQSQEHPKPISRSDSYQERTSRGQAEEERNFLSSQPPAHQNNDTVKRQMTSTSLNPKPQQYEYVEEETFIKDISGTRMSQSFLKHFEEMNKALIQRYESNIQSSAKLVDRLQQKAEELSKRVSLYESKIGILEKIIKEKDEENALCLAKLTEVKLEYAQTMNQLSKYVAEEKTKVRQQNESAASRRNSKSNFMQILGFE